MTFYIRLQHLTDEGLYGLVFNMTGHEDMSNRLVEYVNNHKELCGLCRACPRSIKPLLSKMLAEEEDKKLKREGQAFKKVANKQLARRKRLMREAKKIEESEESMESESNESTEYSE